MRRIGLKIIKAGLIIIAALLLFVLVCNIWIMGASRSKVYSSPESLPPKDVALVLGTSKYSRQGRTNLFFKHRMQAAANLYHLGKVKHFILSGDNSQTYYNEPEDMRKALLALGIPEAVITLDYAGFRTFDSIVRCKKIFGQEKIIIITQEFHIYRALFISRYFDMDAVGFVAEKVPVTNTLGTRLREYLARCKAVIDLYVLKEQPKFLGKKVKIKIE